VQISHFFLSSTKKCDKLEEDTNTCIIGIVEDSFDT